jgi:hypothetical protein
MIFSRALSKLAKEFYSAQHFRRFWHQGSARHRLLQGPCLYTASHIHGISVVMFFN